jgi:hypothetical protein
VKLHILSQSKGSKSLTPLPDHKYGWLKLGHQEVRINDCVNIATTKINNQACILKKLYIAKLWLV